MLEFLGMEQEANTLVTCLMTLGVSIGLIGGYILGAKDNGKGVLGIILYIICGILGVIAIFKGFWPGIALFFTFQWGIWIKGIFLGVIVGFLSGYIMYSLVISVRIRKYARNPITKEAIQFIKNNNVNAVLCYKDSIFFFEKLVSTTFCKSQNYETHDSFDTNALRIRSNHKTETGLDTQLSSGGCIGRIIFAEKGWPEIPDLAVFSKALTKKLHGCRRVHHHGKANYYNTLKSIRYITHFYDAYLIYKRSAYRSLRKQEQHQSKNERKALKKNNTNTWE